MEDEKKCILYIDDDEDEYVIIKFYLSGFSERYDLFWVDNFNDGLKQILDSKYDICVLDYRLGTSSGIDLVRKARENGCRIPVLFLSGQGEEKIDHEALDAGATYCLDKGDINSGILESSIRKCFEKSGSGIA